MSGGGGIEDVLPAEGRFWKITHPKDGQNRAGEQLRHENQGANFRAEFGKPDHSRTQETNHPEDTGNHSGKKNLGEQEGDPGNEKGKE
jgi:hypothetical protein